MNLRTVALTLLTAFAPGAYATPIYDLWNLHNGGDLVALEGWGLKIERLFGSGVTLLGVDDPGGAQLYVSPGTAEVHLLAQLSGSGGSDAGIYTLNLMFSEMTATSASLMAGYSTGGPHVLGTLTAPGGAVYHVMTAPGSGPSLTLGPNAHGLGLEATGSLRFCTDATCESLVADAVGTLGLGAACAANSDCSGLPRARTIATSAPRLQTYQPALPPDGFDAADVPEPATYLLLGGGLVAFTAVKRRKA